MRWPLTKRNKEVWGLWFAWKPVKIRHQWVWLEWVWRREIVTQWDIEIFYTDSLYDN